MSSRSSLKERFVCTEELRDPVHRVREGGVSGDTACYVWLEQEESFGYKRGSISKPPASSGQAKGSSYRYYSIPRQHCDLGTGVLKHRSLSGTSHVQIIAPSGFLV